MPSTNTNTEIMAPPIEKKKKKHKFSWQDLRKRLVTRSKERQKLLDEIDKPVRTNTTP